MSAPETEAIARRVIEDPKWASKQDTRFWRAHVASLLDSLAAARAESDALRAALEKMATDWEATARSLLIVRGYGENIKGWAFEACASDLRAALAPSPAEPVAPEREP